MLNVGSWGFGFSSRNWGHGIAIETDKFPFAGRPTNHNVIGGIVGFGFLFFLGLGYGLGVEEG